MVEELLLSRDGRRPVSCHARVSGGWHGVEQRGLDPSGYEMLHRLLPAWRPHATVHVGYGGRLMVRQRDFSDLNLTWRGYLIAWVLATGAAIVLWYVNPGTFPLGRAIPATLVYFTTYWLAMRYGFPFLAKRLARGSFLQSNFLAEVFFTTVLACIGFLAGSGAGATWWLAGGFAVADFWTAVLVGGTVGAIAPLALLGGG